MKNRVCYYCGRLASSNEHVPPKQLFKGLHIPRFTVPSCEKHNNEKSQADDAIIKGMLMALDNPRYRYKQPLKVLNIMEKVRPHYSRVKRQITRKPLLYDGSTELRKLTNSTVYLESSVNINGWIRQLTAALIFAGSEIYDSSLDWDSAELFAPDYLATDQSGPYSSSQLLQWTIDANNKRDNLNTNLDWRPGWQPQNKAYPVDLFQFYIAITGSYVTVRLKFFNQYTWFISFEASPQTLNFIKAALTESNKL